MLKAAHALNVADKLMAGRLAEVEQSFAATEAAGGNGKEKR